LRAQLLHHFASSLISSGLLLAGQLRLERVDLHAKVAYERSIRSS
jgi:hypothetical protein